MNVRDHTTASNGGLDESVELLIASDSELEVSRCDSLHLEILASVSCELKNLSSQVLEDSCSINGRSGSNSAVSANSTLQESVNSSNGELKIVVNKYVNRRRKIQSLSFTDALIQAGPGSIIQREWHSMNKRGIESHLIRNVREKD